jgi:signal transduction histidine kinase
MVYNNGSMKLLKESGHNLIKAGLPDSSVLSQVAVDSLFGSGLTSNFNPRPNPPQLDFGMVARIGHDIQSPIMAIECVLREMPFLGEDLNSEILRNSVVRLKEISSQLRSLQKPSVGDISSDSVRVNDLIKDSQNIVYEKSVQVAHAKIIHISLSTNELNTDALNQYCQLDRSLFKRSISNLLQNSIESCLEKIYNFGTTKPLIIKIKFQKEQNKLLIKVIDQGTGMAHNQIENVMKKTFSSTKGGEHQGLGLSSTIENVEKWGGELRLSSQLEVGTTITLALPFT